MVVSNFIDGSDSFNAHSPIAWDLQQFRGFEGVKHFDGQNLFVQESRVTQVRARTFIRFLEQNLNPQEKSKSALGSLLKQVLQLFDSEEDRQRLGEISQAFFKQRGYFSRLFSGESWKEWTENRTALGRVVSHLRDCMESRTQVDSFTKRLDVETIRKANKEAAALLKRFDHRDATTKRSFSSEISCGIGLVGGIFGSLITQHPLPLLLLLSQCFPRVSAQQKVGSEFQINNYTANDQMYPAVASFPNGNFVVTWQSLQQDGSLDGVYGQLFDGNDTKIGNEFRANTYTSNGQADPSVTSFSNGNFVVTWQSDGQDGSYGGVYGQLFDGTGTKIGSEFRANSYTADTQRGPSVTSFSNGNFVVTWHSNGQESGWGVYGQLFNGTGTTIGSEFRANSYTTWDQEYPSVASLVDGNFVVTWQSENQDTSNSYGIFGQFFNESGSKVGSELRINSYAIDRQERPAVASFNNGNFVVTWSSNWQDGDLNGVYGQFFQGNGKRIRSEFQVHTDTRYAQESSAVTSLDNGHFIVVWQSGTLDGSLWGVYGQLFDENGSKIGNEFQINTYTADSQSDAAVASLKNGNFVVVWNSNLQDGAGYGIYGQIFHDNFTLTSNPSFTSTFPTTTTTSRSVTSDPASSSSTMESFTGQSTSNNTPGSTTETSAPTSSSSTTHPITTDRILVTSDIASKFTSTAPDRNNNFLWFLLGASGWAACLALTSYLFLKSRRREEGGDEAELREERDDEVELREERGGEVEHRGERNPRGDLMTPSPEREEEGEYANDPRFAREEEGEYANVPRV